MAAYVLLAAFAILGGCSEDAPFGAKRVALALANAECACAEDSSCVANEARKLERWIDNGVAKGRFSLDDETLAACEDQIASCQASTPACDALLQGETPPEGACTESAECAGDAFCKRTPGASKAPSCPGLGTCQPRAGRDEPCTHSLQCSGSLTCVASEEPGVGVCSDPVGEGQRCFFESLDGEAVYALCEGRGKLVCASDNTCKRSARSAPPRGAPCDFDFECADEDFCDEGTCAGRRLPGESCNTKRQCQRDLTCKQSVCREASDLGRGCDPSRGNDDCLSPWICDGNGVCSDLSTVCFEQDTAPPPARPDAGHDGSASSPSALGNACHPGEKLGDAELYCAADGVLQGVVTRDCSREAPEMCDEADGTAAICLTQGVCARACASDSECAFGLRCDPQLGACTR